MKPKVLSEKPITGAELKEDLEAMRKRDEEASPRALRTEDHLNQSVQLEGKKARELAAALAKLNVPRLREQHISKIVDVLPATVNDLKAVLQGYVITVSAENIKKIVDKVKEFISEGS